MAEASLDLGTGKLYLEEIKMLFRAIPVSIDFVDETNTLRFFSARDEERAAKRKKALGENVLDCHSTESRAQIERMIDEFKAGREESFSFSYDKDGSNTRVLYFPMRDEEGNYKGILELSGHVADFRDTRIGTGQPEPGG